MTDEMEDALVLSIDCSIDADFRFWCILSYQEVIQNYNFGNFGKLYLGDGEPLEIVGMGDVCRKMANGIVWKINEVRHVSRLTKNLISVGQLDEGEFGVSYVNGSWKVSKGAMVVARGSKTRTLYMTSSRRHTYGNRC